MGKFWTRAAALTLAAVLTAGPAASASQALGSEVHTGKAHLAEGVEYTRQYLWSATYSDLRTERYLEYTPNSLVQPAVAYGGTVLTKRTLTALAQGLESAGKRVLGGINGDFYVLATGAPLGMVVTDGVLRSSSSYHYAIGFDAEGSAFIGKPELSITATFLNSTYAVAGGLNKVRDASGLVLYTDDYSATTNHTQTGVDVILIPSTHQLDETVWVDLEVEDISEQEQPEDEAPDSITDSADLDEEDVTQGVRDIEQVQDTLVYTDEPTIGGRMSCTVAQVLQSTGSVTIPEGALVLSINNSSSAELVQALSSLQEGDTVEIDITSPDARWETAVTALGAMYQIVTDGAVTTTSSMDSSQAPRTAVGVKADGSTIFYTVDGRQSGASVGASIEQVAKRLVELGCVQAVCLDGGGSTTFGASLPGEEDFALLNSPSDGAQRSVTNALFLVADQAEAGEADQLALSPGDAILLSGSQLELSAFSVDELGQTVELYEADQVDFDLPRAAGSVSDGVLTAGDQAGTYDLQAEADRLTGSALITVVSNPDRITVRSETTGAALSSLSLEPGETVDLTAGAVYRNLSLICQDEAFTWSVTGDLASVDESGTLTAGQNSGSGSLQVSAGAATVTIPLTVASQVHTVESFEGDFQNMSGSLTAQIEPEQRSAYVRCGSQSAKVTYDVGQNEFAAFGLPLDLPDSAYLALWVYGDGSGNTLTAPVRTADGGSSEMTLAVLDFKGWQQVVVPLPDGAAQILMMKLLPTGTGTQGTIWLDQVTASSQSTPDTTPPVVTITSAPASGTLRAAVQDDLDREFSLDQITVTYDGTELPFTLESGTISASLPGQDGKAHRITVTAADASGNIGRSSADIAASEQAQPFADMDGHWAAGYVNYLYDQGISNGVAVEGQYYFNPDKDITRGEFALMFARWLRLDLTAYSGVELPFADTSEIPSWCLDAVKAMYALGVMEGSAESTGTYAYAQRSISRAEAMTMLGRIQSKGYASAELTFADAADIPAWAADYVATMVAQGVVNGYTDNTVAPNASIKRSEMAKILYAMR